MPHFEVPSAEPQTELIVSGNCLLKFIVCTGLVGCTEMEVTETKGVAGVV